MLNYMYCTATFHVNCKLTCAVVETLPRLLLLTAGPSIQEGNIFFFVEVWPRFQRILDLRACNVRIIPVLRARCAVDLSQQTGVHCTQ